LNVGDPDEDTLNQRGEFEALFRLLRTMLGEFVGAPGEVERVFAAPPDERAAIVARCTAHRYWPALFASCFAVGLLHAMFAPAATKQAAAGSYPGYFQRVFERGLGRDDAARNPFLQHVLLGAYRKDDAPPYTRARSPRRPELVEGDLARVPELGRFELYSLSN